jgi:NAD(P)-dependent dehydrogenase (short-subunit alcohol dehydrogenase family)
MTRAFLALIGRDKPASVINITGGIITVVMPAASAYTLSKLALTHLQQFVAAEYPRVTAVAVHPGVVKTDMTLPQFERFAVDPPALVGGFAVWAATDAARFLNGRFVDAHWSVDELVARRDEIAGQGQLLTGLKAKLGRDNL